MKNAGKACNNRLYRHIRTFEKIIKNYFVISEYKLASDFMRNLELFLSEDISELIYEPGEEGELKSY